jgi:hypothetical protein
MEKGGMGISRKETTRKNDLPFNFSKPVFQDGQMENKVSFNPESIFLPRKKPSTEAIEKEITIPGRAQKPRRNPIKSPAIVLGISERVMGTDKAAKINIQTRGGWASSQLF